MNTNLMIDTLQIITQKSQSSIQQVIRKYKSSGQKLRLVQLYLSEMKVQIFEWVSNVLCTTRDTKDIVKRLDDVKLQTEKQIKKHQLHILLKKKLNKLKKQSFLHSVVGNDSQENSFHFESTMINDLEKSVLHIEKDLNIEPEEQDDNTGFGLSSIIQKSRMINNNMDLTQIYKEDQNNVSTISEYEVFNLGQEKDESPKSKFGYVKEDAARQSRNENQSGLLQTFSLKNSSLYSRTQQETTQNKEISMPTLIENEPKDIKELQAQQQNKIENDQTVNKLANPPKIMKKKKKSIYTNIGKGASLSKEDLLGNLLEESYQSCLQSENK